MQRQTDAPAVMEVIVSAVAGTIPGAEHATISLVHGRRRVASAAATGELARRFDDLQQETRQPRSRSPTPQDLDHITTALGSRDLIGQAKGILMEGYRITAGMAFALLAKTSQDANRKLHEVAEHLTLTGTLGR